MAACGDPFAHLLSSCYGVSLHHESHIDQKVSPRTILLDFFVANHFREILSSRDLKRAMMGRISFRCMALCHPPAATPIAKDSVPQ